MEPFGSILGALGSMASLISLFVLWKRHTSWVLPAALLLIFALTASSSYLSYQYYQLTQPEVVRLAKHEALRSSIRVLLANCPNEPSYLNPGLNEGIVNSGLIILELHKDLFPESYAKIRSYVEADISFSRQHRDKQEQRVALDTAAKNVLTLLKALAGGS